MNEQSFDVVVIGGGPGGYPAAIKAAQAGKTVALIEKGDMGGTCLNRGCIPTKALIANADILRQVKRADDFGIQVGDVSFDYSVMNRRKDALVAKIRKGLEQLIASNKIKVFKGVGKFVSPKQIQINGSETVTGRSVIIATGAEPKNMPAFPFDDKKVLSSTSILALDTLPKKIAIIGGGVIGCEFASLYAAFNVEVTVIEALSTILPLESSGVSAALTKAFEKKGIKILCNALVQSIESTTTGIKIRLAGDTIVEADVALVAVGRTRNTKDIGLEKTGVTVTKEGEIPTNDKMETNVPGIYAIGDVTGNWWLAHVATHQGLVAAGNAVGQSAKMHYHAIPAVIFTEPEIATVGMSLDQALKEGYQATVGSFPFAVLGKAQASGETEGFAQVVTDKRTGQLLGAQVLGHDASTLIAEMGVAIANELTLECMMETIHAHPTVAEAWLEAAYLANETPLHLPPRRKP